MLIVPLIPCTECRPIPNTTILGLSAFALAVPSATSALSLMPGQLLCVPQDLASMLLPGRSPSQLRCALDLATVAVHVALLGNTLLTCLSSFLSPLNNKVLESNVYFFKSTI